MSLAGAERGVMYLRMSGCERGSSECYGPLRADLLYRVSLDDGEPARVDSVPESARRGGEMLARRPGERRYLRLSKGWDRVSARWDPEADFRPVFRVDSTGRVHRLEG